jgi:aspartyl aminopeptidase
LKIILVSDQWALVPGESYYYTRNQSTIVAFTLGQNVQAGVDLYKIIGCHTDSPVLKLAPYSKIQKLRTNVDFSK